MKCFVRQDHGRPEHCPEGHPRVAYDDFSADDSLTPVAEE